MLQITAALLSGNQQQASRLIKQGLQSGNTGAVSKALASASANVSISSSCYHISVRSRDLVTKSVQDHMMLFRKRICPSKL